MREAHLNETSGDDTTEIAAGQSYRLLACRAVLLSRREVLAAVPLIAAGPSKGAWQTAQLQAKAALHVYLPAGYSTAKKHPLVVALPGWNHSPELWRQKSDLAPYADQHGCVIAMPAMGKTIYETKFYPETKSPPIPRPGTLWVGEVVLPWVRAQHAVHADRAHTAIVGYSTGGRGAVLVAEAYPEFSFAGSVSGTFDLMRLPTTDGEYKIHAAIYGPRDQFEARWQLDNCTSPARLDALTGTRLYAAHGEKDNVVKPDQLTALEAALEGRDVKADFVRVPGAGHDWKLWSSQWAPMFDAASKIWKESP